MKHIVGIRCAAAVVACCAIALRPAFGQVEALVDLYSTPVDTPVDIAAPGILLNDAADDSIGARLVTGPLHGEVDLSTDGSLFYMPDVGFEGRDSLSYVAQVLRPLEFVIDSTSTVLELDADLSSSFGSDDDREASRLGGTVTGFLLPHEPPYLEVHVADLSIVFLDELNFEFSVLFSSLHADVNAGDMVVTMLESGGPVAADGSTFDQAENHVQLDATTTLSGSLISTSEERIVIEDSISLAGSIVLNGTVDSLRLELPIELEGSYATSGVEVDIAISGTIYAAVVYEPAVESAETLVRFEVGLPATAVEPSELPESTLLHPAYPNPFNPEAVVEYEVAAETDVRLSLYDVTGREVVRLVDRRQAAGRYEVRLQAGALPSGVYLLRLQTDSVSRTSRVVLAK